MKTFGLLHVFFYFTFYNVIQILTLLSTVVEHKPNELKKYLVMYILGLTEFFIEI